MDLTCIIITNDIGQIYKNAFIKILLTLSTDASFLHILVCFPLQVYICIYKIQNIISFKHSDLIFLYHHLNDWFSLLTNLHFDIRANSVLIG